jgi:hypothetical protein
MATDKQITANRENSKLAGVKTDEGKRKVRFNALKHGLSSKHLLDLKDIFQEEHELYLEILEGFSESIKPQSFLEEILVDKMARAYFKLQRCEQLEQASFKKDYEFSYSDAELGIDGFKASRADSYRSRLESQFSRAKEELVKARGAFQLDLFSLKDVSNE